MRYMTLRTAEDVIDALHVWLDQDEPLVEAIGDTLAQYSRTDSQEQARRVVATVISVLEEYLDRSE
jgi:hypothetical protein